MLQLRLPWTHLFYVSKTEPVRSVEEQGGEPRLFLAVSLDHELSDRRLARADADA